MLSENQTRAAKLRDALSELYIQLDLSECVEILSKLESDTDRNTLAVGIGTDQLQAEQFLDEFIEALLEADYEKFTRRFERKYLVNFPESEFLRDIRHTHEDVGNYIRREFMGCINCKQDPGDNRYPNHIRYIWRCIFEKNEVLARVGVYEKDGTHYVSGARTL